MADEITRKLLPALPVEVEELMSSACDHLAVVPSEEPRPL
jgi:hypothetical protein